MKNIMDFTDGKTNWDNIKIGLRKYERLMELFSQVDVSQHEEFQRLFNGFYRIRRRKPDFYKALYSFLEKHKDQQTTFAEILGYFFERFSRLEASFSSKILATINPEMPIWDSEVLKRLKIKTPSYSLPTNERLEQMIDKYHQIIAWYDDFINTEEAETMIQNFDREIGETSITTVKKIDFILWQTRE